MTIQRNELKHAHVSEGEGAVHDQSNGHADRDESMQIHNNMGKHMIELLTVT